MNVKQNYTNEIICECGNKYKTQGHYNRHLQCSKHVRYLQFAEQPLREYSELKGDLRYSFDKLRSPTNVNAILEKYNTIDIYTQQPVTFENNGRLQKQYEIEHIHEVQVLVYAIKRATPSLLGRALGPLCEIINDIPNLGICHKSVNILKGGAVKYFLDHLEKPKKISFYDALTRYSTGAIRPNAHNSIREARQYNGYVTGHNVYGLLADQFDSIIAAMELDLDYNTVVYDQLTLTDRLGTNQHTLNTNVHPQNLFPTVSCLPNPNGADQTKRSIHMPRM